MEKINLSVERKFSDLITTTINFVRQEFVPFFRGFGVIVIPVLLLIFFFQKEAFETQFLAAFNRKPALADQLLAQMWNSLEVLVLGLWIQLYTLAYIRVYRDHYLAGNEDRVAIRDVWRMMIKKWGRYFMWSFAYLLVIVVGVVLLVVPAIYFGIALCMGACFIMFKDEGVDSSFSCSMLMIKGNWWRTLGYLSVLQILINMVAYLFSIPHIVTLASAGLRGEMPNIYELTFTFLLSQLGNYIFQTVSVVGISVLFFSLLEREEHTTLLNRVAEIGSDLVTKEDEEEK